MKRLSILIKQTSIAVIFFLSSSLQLLAQKDSLAIDSGVIKNVIAVDSMPPLAQPAKMMTERQPMNIVKINILGILLQNYQLQYERVIS